MIKFRGGEVLNIDQVVVDNVTLYPEWVDQTPVIYGNNGYATVRYVFAEEEGLDRTNSYADSSGNNPRIMGMWPGDYYEFYAPFIYNGKCNVHFIFTMRISAGGVRHWRLEYERMDGTWKPMGQLQTITGTDGKTWEYNLDLYPGGSADTYNQQIGHIIPFPDGFDHIRVRLYCASNIPGNSTKPMTKISTGSVRFDDTPISFILDTRRDEAMTAGYIGATPIQKLYIGKNQVFPEVEKLPYNMSFAPLDMTGTFLCDGETRNFADYPDGYVEFASEMTDQRAFWRNTQITYFNSNVGYVRDQTFAGCTNLETVKIGDVIQIGYNVFGGCVKLSSVWCEPVKYIVSYAFEGCASLNELYCPNLQYIGLGAFTGCTNLEYIAGCDNAYTLEFEDREDLDIDPFEGCVNFRGIVVPDEKYAQLIQNVPDKWKHYVITWSQFKDN